MEARNQALLWLGIGAGLAVAAAALRRGRFSFEGRSVLVTGGSRGLGLVMARELAERGARVAICARDGDELARAREDLEARGAAVEAAVCDLRDREQVEAMVHDLDERLGGIDVLINNAGVIGMGPLDTMTLADFEREMRTHFWGPLYTTLAVLPSMRRRGEGRIVNISSIGGKVSVPHLLPYCASKFALVGLSEGLRAELAQEGIVVTTVCPGLMRTGSPRNADFKGQHRAEYAWFILGDSLPGASMSAERAARQVLDACERGDSEVVLSLPAKAAALFHGVFPGLTADLLGAMNRLLPGPGGIGTQRAKGKESESPLTQSVLTILTQWAARRNNEVG